MIRPHRIFKDSIATSDWFAVVNLENNAILRIDEFYCASDFVRELLADDKSRTVAQYAIVRCTVAVVPGTEVCELYEP
jgi:hypothetical protein